MGDGNDNEDRSASGPPEVDDIWMGEGSLAYDALKEIDRLYDEFSEMMEAIEERASQDDPVVVLKPKERTKSLEFYTVVYAHLERMAAVALYEGIGDKSQRDRVNTLAFFREEFTQSTREELLFYSGLIGPGLKSEMARVRRNRNSIAHSQARRMFIDFAELSPSDVKRARDTVDKLEEVVEDQIGYCIECDEAPLFTVDSPEVFKDFVDENEVNELWLDTDSWFDERDSITYFWCPECHTMFRDTFEKVSIQSG